eukprot:1176560-Prorocentrum_minimum.AAC.3
MASSLSKMEMSLDGKLMCVIVARTYADLLWASNSVEVARSRRSPRVELTGSRTSDADTGSRDVRPGRCH